MVYAPGHPLAFTSPYVPEHRLKLWRRIGPGNHPCHWCGVEVAWLPGSRTAGGSLVTDHLDRDRLNNADSNLVPACQSCNTRNREYTVRDDELYRTRPNGTRLRGFAAVCIQCDKSFVAWPGSPGKFCSRSCTVRWQHTSRRTSPTRAAQTKPAR